MGKRSLFVFGFVASVAVVAAVVVALLNGVPGSDRNASSTVVQSGATVEATDSEAAMSAAAALADALTAANSGSDKGDAASRMYRVSEGDVSVLDAAGLDARTRYSAGFEASAGLVGAYQYAMVAIAAQVQPDGGPVAAPSATSVGGVYVDRTAGLAYVPLSTFSGSAPAMSVLMVRVGGQWLVEPYGVLDDIRLSNTVQDAARGQAGSTQSGQRP